MNLNQEARKIFDRFKDLPESERFKAYDKIERSLYESDLVAFAHAMGYTKVHREVHDSIIQVLTSTARRKLIVVPRGCFKSTLCSVIYPVWRHIRDPNLRILVDSELLSNSSKFMREIESCLQSSTMTRLYGNMRRKDKTWNNTEMITALRTDHTKKEASFTASGVGAQKTGLHFDIACLDDLSTPASCSTPEQQQKVIDHYRYFTSILDPEHGEIVVVGTRYSENDIIGFVIDNELDSDQRKALGF